MKQSVTYKDYILLSLSAVLYSISIIYITSWLSFICLVPVFITLFGKNIKQTIGLASLFGTLCGSILCYWMLASIAALAGDENAKNIILYIISIGVNIVFFNIIFLAYFGLQKLAKRPSLLYSSAVASMWTILEILHYQLFKAVPFLFSYPSLTSYDNEVFIQNASLIGTHGLTFLIVLINHIFYQAFHLKSVRKYWFLGISTLILVHLTGLLSVYHFQQNKDILPDVDVVIVNEQHPAGTVWNESTGDSLVQSIFANNKSAQQINPDIILWSESLVPWTFDIKDDFLNTLANNSNDSVIHVLGMPSYYDEGHIYNSCYSLDVADRSYQRYDKIELIPMAEKRLDNSFLPYIGNHELSCISGKYEQSALLTRKGNIGIMICNETNIWEAAQRMRQSKAQYFLAPGSNAWFFDFPLILNQHFYSCRVRAIEQRKDIAVNFNKGYSGHISANGVIQFKIPNEHAFVKKIHIKPNNYTSFFSHYPNLLIYLSVLQLVMYCLYNISKP